MMKRLGIGVNPGQFTQKKRGSLHDEETVSHRGASVRIEVARGDHDQRRIDRRASRNGVENVDASRR